MRDGRRRAGDGESEAPALRTLGANLFHRTETRVMLSMTLPSCSESPEGVCSVSLKHTHIKKHSLKNI